MYHVNVEETKKPSRGDPEMQPWVLILFSGHHLVVFPKFKCHSQLGHQLHVKGGGQTVLHSLALH